MKFCRNQNVLSKLLHLSGDSMFEENFQESHRYCGRISTQRAFTLKLSNMGIVQTEKGWEQKFKEESDKKRRKERKVKTNGIDFCHKFSFLFVKLTCAQMLLKMLLIKDICLFESMC